MMPTMKDLERFIGEWTVEASFEDASPGRTSFEWMLDGQYLLERSESPDPAPDSVAIIAPGTEGG